MDDRFHRAVALAPGLMLRLLVAFACVGLFADCAEADPPPTITSFSPTQGIAGSTVVTIHGTGFQPTMFVSFYGEAAFLGVKVISATELVVTVPGEAITGPIGISGSNGSTGTPTDFVVTGHVPIKVIPSFEVISSAREVTVGSGQYGEFTLDTPVAGPKDVWVHYALSGSAVNGQDYRLRTGFVEIKAQVYSKTIKIIPQGDLGGASKKTVRLTLLPGEGYLVANRNTSNIRILAGP